MCRTKQPVPKRDLLHKRDTRTIFSSIVPHPRQKVKGDEKNKVTRTGRRLRLDTLALRLTSELVDLRAGYAKRIQ